MPAAVGKNAELGDIGVQPVTRPQILGVVAGAPADQSGLRPLDVIVAVDGERDIGGERVVELIRSNGGRPLAFEFERGGARQTVTVTPRLIDDAQRIGATISPYKVPDRPAGARRGHDDEHRTQLERRAGHRPIPCRPRHAQNVGQATAGTRGDCGPDGHRRVRGWVDLFSLMATISLSLGLLNLMPIPVLDGGHIAILAMEGVARRDFSMKAKEHMLAAGFVLLVTLMATVIYNDLMRIAWIERLLPWR